MSKPLSKVAKSGKITVFGVELECHVLENGKRIIEQESLLRLMEAMSSGKPLPQEGILDYAAFMHHGTLPGDKYE